MEPTTAIDFISSTLFRCNFCKTRLQYPVMKVEDVGNFCGSCVRKTKYKKAVENEDVHKLLVNVQLFCKYRNRGCTAKEYFKNISLHEKACNFRDKSCPFALVNKCMVEACQDLVDHIKKNHSRSMKIDHNNHYEFNFDLNSVIDEIKILIFGNDYFILHVTVGNDKLWYFIYYVGEESNLKKFTFTIQNRGNNLLTETEICPILHDSEFSKFFPGNETTSYHLESLKLCLGSEIRTLLTVNIVGFTIDTHSLLDAMECPVCNNFMGVEIPLCKTGHSVCAQCRKHLKRCPMCLLPFTNARNYCLESVGRLLKDPYECRFLCPRQATKDHTCSACCHECPFSDVRKCEWHGLYKDIIEHLTDDHNGNTFYSSQMTRVVFLSEEICDNVCLVAHGYTFKVTTQKRRDDDRLMIQFRVIGQKHADKYSYRLTTNGKLFRRIVNYNIPIYSLHTTQECVTYNISARTLARVVHNSRVVITCSILQR